jgi:ribosomal protein S18 acetylase RimI-like enzyme
MPTISRAAEPRDGAAILSLAQAFATSFFVEPSTFQQAFSALLTDTHLRLIVAEQDEQVIGYLLGSTHMTFYANGSVAWVEEITVNEAYRGQGIGRMLMHDFERWAAERDARLVALATRRAAAFYESLGYEESARYYRKLL